MDAYLVSKGWVASGVFFDVKTGSSDDRPGLNKLMAELAEKKHDIVAVVKLDRLARSLVHFLRIVADFERMGVALVCTSQGIDTSKGNACGRLQMNVLSAVAEFERDLIRERTRAGLVAAKARGARIGRPSVTITPEWRAAVAAWRGSGRTYRHLAQELNVPVSTAWRLVRGT